MTKRIFKRAVVLSLTFFAREALRKYKPRIIAVAGSVGKTSTQNAIHTVLRTVYSVRKSEKSFNTEIGVPLTILGLPNAWGNPWRWFVNFLRAADLLIFRARYPRYLILEMGADVPGDIRHIVSWAKPDIAVITRFGEVPVHVEFFKGREELIAEDGLVAECLRRDGLLLVNEDDPDSLAMRGKTKAKSKSFGFTRAADIVASHVQISYGEDGAPAGISCKVDLGGTNAPLRLPGVIGKAQVYATLPALLIGDHLGVNLVSGVEALSAHVPPPGRLKLIEGVKRSTIVDDTYNASPVAAEAALEALKEVKTKGKKIAVLGDMLELGRSSEDEHLRIGKLAGAAADVVVAVGIRARGIARGALTAGLTEKNIFQFESSKEAGKFVEGILAEGDIALVKGSQSMRMERVVEEIMRHPEEKERLLVRQDEEWQKR
ncbi:MAG: UDP-N-acetylmuramoyl-tripeptide--D-alanyl-D-alanine ligase [bacterium]|nr:UDP-N-acetylmuramoyl-tripeptide--D-alanyl-D-alanine ligase [bacterium]